MGYPMTYRRVVHRNGLHEGDYGNPPPRTPTVGVNLDALIYVKTDEMRRYFESMRNWSQMVAGDLRRLEADAIDEGAVCAEVSRRTGIDATIVAAVLREFMTI